MRVGWPTTEDEWASTRYEPLFNQVLTYFIRQDQAFQAALRPVLFPPDCVQLVRDLAAAVGERITASARLRQRPMEAALRGQWRQADKSVWTRLNALEAALQLTATASPPAMPLPSTAQATPRATPEATPRATPRPAAGKWPRTARQYLDDVEYAYGSVAVSGKPVSFDICSNLLGPEERWGCMETWRLQQESVERFARHRTWMRNHPASCLKDAYAKDRALMDKLEYVFAVGTVDAGETDIKTHVHGFFDRLPRYVSDCR